MEKIQQGLEFYARHLYVVDFMFILFVFFLFTGVCILCVFLRHRPFTALIIIALNIISCFLLSFYGYEFIDSKARSREVQVVSHHIIKSTNSLVIDFNITNTSKTNFKDCKIMAKIFNTNSSSFLNKYKNKFIPSRQKSVKLENLKQNSSQYQRISFENFTDNNYTLKLASECF